MCIIHCSVCCFLFSYFQIWTLSFCFANYWCYYINRWNSFWPTLDRPKSIIIIIIIVIFTISFPVLTHPVGKYLRKHMSIYNNITKLPVKYDFCRTPQPKNCQCIVTLNESKKKYTNMKYSITVYLFIYIILYLLLY